MIYFFRFTGTLYNDYSVSFQKKATAYAAKMFSDKSRRLHMKYVQREIDLLNHLPKHDNIVQLIGLEKEVKITVKQFLQLPYTQS